MHGVKAQKTILSVSTAVPPRFISLILHPKPDSPYLNIECATSDVLISNTHLQYSEPTSAQYI